MLVSLVLMLLGLGMLVLGSDFLVDGASSIAKKIGISEFVIGIIIVGFGTSCPELVVSITGALNGSSAVALGNVMGSNTLNILLILGLTALLSPIAVTDTNKKKDIPILMCASFFFSLVALKGEINRLTGALLIVIFTIYIIYNFKSGKKAATPEEEESTKSHPVWLSSVMVLAGLAGLVFGGKLFVNNAVELAHAMGASEKFIAITVLALGTSLPELVTCVVAAAKKKGQLALGNVVGSNVFNILLILGCSALISPLSTESVNYVDLIVMNLSVIMLYLFGFFKSQVSKKAGAGLLCVELAYLVYLFIKL